MERIIQYVCDFNGSQPSLGYAPSPEAAVSGRALVIKPVVDSDRPLIITLMGPTASGKTDLAIALAESMPCDIISVDSAQVYRGMDIGTAKPDAGTLRRAPHQLLDFLDPADAYSVVRFRRDALDAIHRSIAAKRIPLLVGGTMLYFKALIYGIAELPPADSKIRADIEAEARQHGWATIHRRLAGVDPVAARRIHSSDSQRLQRALEVYEISGRSLTRWQQGQVPGDAQKDPLAAFAPDLPAPVVQLALAPLDRGELHRRIEQRFRLMVESGLVEEARALWQRPDLPPGLPAMRAVGYRQVIEYLEGRTSIDQMIEAGIVATRQLAKRQLTWLRSWQHLNWLWTDAGGSSVMAPPQVADCSPLQGAIYYLRNKAS